MDRWSVFNSPPITRSCHHWSDTSCRQLCVQLNHITILLNQLEPLFSIQFFCLWVIQLKPQPPWQKFEALCWPQIRSSLMKVNRIKLILKSKEYVRKLLFILNTPHLVLMAVKTVVPASVVPVVLVSWVAVKMWLNRTCGQKKIFICSHVEAWFQWRSEQYSVQIRDGLLRKHVLYTLPLLFVFPASLLTLRPPRCKLFGYILHSVHVSDHCASRCAVCISGHFDPISQN